MDTTKRTAKLNAAATIQALTADDSPRRGAAGSNVNGVAAKRGAAAAASKSASASKRTRRSRKEESEDEEEDAEDDDFELDEDEEESDDDDNDDEYNASDDEDDDDVELDGEMEEAEFRAGDYDGEVLSTGGDDVAHMDVIPEEDEDASEGGAATPENVITATTNGRGRPSAAAAKKPATTRGKTGEATASAAVERAEAAPANKRGKVGPAAARGAAANRGRSAAPPAPVFQKIRPSANERFPWKLQPGLPLTEEEQKIALPAAEENVKPLSPRKKHLAYKPSAKQRPSQPGTRRWDKFLPPGFVDDDGAEAAAEGEAAAPETVEVSPSLHPLLRDIPQCEKLKGLAADNWRNMLDDGDVDALLVPHSNGDGGAAQAQDGAKNGKEGNHDDNDGESYDKDESHNDGDVHPEGEKDDEGREMDAGPMESATDDVGSLMDTNHPPEGRDTVVVGAAE